MTAPRYVVLVHQADLDAARATGDPDAPVPVVAWADLADAIPTDGDPLDGDICRACRAVRSPQEDTDAS